MRRKAALASSPQRHRPGRVIANPAALFRRLGYAGILCEFVGAGQQMSGIVKSHMPHQPVPCAPEMDSLGADIQIGTLNDAGDAPKEPCDEHEKDRRNRGHGTVMFINKMKEPKKPIPNGGKNRHPSYPSIKVSDAAGVPQWPAAVSNL